MGARSSFSRDGGHLAQMFVVTLILCVLPIALAKNPLDETLRWRLAEQRPVATHGILTGIVSDTLCRKVADAMVSVGTVGTTAKTGPDGRFFVAFGPADIGSGQMLLASTIPGGYTENQVKVALGPGNEYSTTMVVKSVAARTMAFTPYKQALIVEEPYRGRVSIPPASLVSTSGLLVSEPVTAQLTTLDLTGEDRHAFPGNDFLGVTDTDQQALVALEIVVSAEVKLVGASGTRYHRFANPATLRLAIPGRLLGRFADRDPIPLWHYDTSTGVWRQEGEGMIRRDPGDGRLWAEGKVAHITWWSFAYPIKEYACLRFRPIDAESKVSLSHLPFKVEGISFNGGAQVTVRDNEVAFTTKMTLDPAKPEQVRLMFDEEGISTYLQRDPANPSRYYQVPMPGLATPISMPGVAVRHTTRWENCHDLGPLMISVHRSTSVAATPKN
ncbi:hypothetical protein CCP3SC5AM1_270004 [Gammaproteobacteria bacterium]